VENSVKNASTQQMVGCSRAEARSFFLAKMDAWNAGHAEKMTFANVHIDHIKPLARMTDAASLAALCHYPNLQPLLVDDNEHKSDHWSPSDELLACPPLHAAGVEWVALHMLARVALENLGAPVESKLI